jgi:hypothetical protein
VFHIELRQFPHVARAFNLTEEELRGRLLGAWLRGDTVELGERRWAPERARLTIYEGPPLREDEIGMGRGWSNATRAGSEVTDQILQAARASEPVAIASSLAEFKREVLEQCAAGRIGIHQVLWLANERHGARRASERLALAEQSIWELLHERRLTMLRPAAATDGLVPVSQEEWEPTLLAWATWAEPRGPSVWLERASNGPP